MQRINGQSHREMKPFFSVCIPATKRSNTIERALQSILNQDFQDFEVIVTTRNDKATYEIVDTFIKNCKIDDKIKNINIETDRQSCNDWNDSILLANGRFIAVLEGDDYFYSDYLNSAHKLIIDFNFDICLFATTNRDNVPKPFVFNKHTFFRYIYSLNAVPAPSESIFPRICNYEAIQYNIADFTYAPEIDLYLRLTTHINNFVRISKVGVYREASSDPNNRISFLYYRDQLIILIKYFRVINIFLLLISLKNLIIVYIKSIIKYCIWKMIR